MAINLNYIYGNGVEVFIDSLKKVPVVHASDVATYASIQTGQINSYPRYVKPTEYSLQGIISSNELEKRRKLEYLNAINSEVLLVLGSEHDATYGVLKSVRTNRISDDVLSISANLSAAGRAISDIAHEAEDLTTDGNLKSDSDASGGEAIEIGTGESIYKSIQQSEYALPVGDYKVFARGMNGWSSGTSDIVLSMYNSTDSVVIGSTTKSLIANEYTLVESDVISISSTDVNDAIQIKVEYGADYPSNIDFIGFARV